MRRIMVPAVLALMLLAPAACLSGTAVLVQAVAGSATGGCDPIEIGPVPSGLVTRTSDGVTIWLDRTQLSRAATIAQVGGRVPGVGRAGVRIALMAALTESSLRMLANTSAHPESVNFHHDGNGGDHDSLGLFQMRPSTGWGTVAELMDPTYQARAFFGGPTGPNHGSPRGLLDIPDWHRLSPGAAAQAVEVSAYPDRYARFEPVADAILNALTHAPATTPATTATRLTFPLPKGTWHATSPYGWRTDPVTGAHALHTGNDYAAPLGTPILAVADGTVIYAGASTSGYAHLILIQHELAGRRFVSGYAHMYADGVLVHVGDHVTAGQHIGNVGADGKATGPHLHFEIRPDGSGPVDPTSWLTGAVDFSAATDGGFGCSMVSDGALGVPASHDDR